MSRPNILFLFSDEHSYRCLSLLEGQTGEPVQTPVLDGLAKHGAYFSSAYCQSPLCTPSRICLLTGRSPMTSGGWANGSYLKPEIPTVASAFAEAGYATCLVGKMHLGGANQMAGFESRPYGDLTGGAGHQRDPLSKSEAGFEMRSRTADAGLTEIPESALQEQVIVRETVTYLREQTAAEPDRPWLLCASFSRPHFPLTAPRRFLDKYWPEGITPPKVERTGDTASHPMTVGMAKGFRTEEVSEPEMMKARAGYFACVDYLDEIIGDLLHLLERSGLLENTIIVYTTDHGEMAGEHGLWWKNSWHEAAARVPLIFQTPSQRSGDSPGRRLDTPVSLADLFPTLCGLAKVEAPDGLEGRDLSKAVTTGIEPPAKPVFVDNPLPRWGEGSEHRLVRLGKYKFVRFRGMRPHLLFDLEADPLEQRNLLVDGTEAEMATGRQLKALVDSSWDFDAAEGQRRKDEEELGRNALREGARRHGNCFRMPDGRIVVADTPLYDPKVVDL
ncbi:MAG: sulfatase-like hydrolase/transferase [Caldilineaceae bacterium SB0664_bin_27]|uniref:Sulfatase-like hydrolase/transferase n=1 Tax=Caldilineaceae bacterium SB0664_bin_27 TaxID=2605260 RepID=A0A6B0YP98_9CHLR|nr:sulfatase-like hydrolase/transferase [Caldilineaceae bacterium SB0664_bin_27]